MLPLRQTDVGVLGLARQSRCRWRLVTSIFCVQQDAKVCEAIKVLLLLLNLDWSSQRGKDKKGGLCRFAKN